MLWQNFLSPEFRKKFQREKPSFLEITEFPFTTVYDGWKEAHMPKTSSTRLAVSIEHQLVTDGQTQTERGLWVVLQLHSIAR